MPWSHKLPGSWIAWALDRRMEIVPDSWVEVRFGEFQESLKRQAYDAAVLKLKSQGESEQPIQFEKLWWQDY